ncbi:MAG: hypothetical protein U1E89_16235 [Burkholderiaceae bacterium]
MIRTLAVCIATLLAGAVQAQQWVQLSDPFAFDTPPPLWCNADRTACIVSRQVYGQVGALRVALTVAGTPDCRQRRLRYIYVKRNGEMAGDVSKIHEVVGQTCTVDIPMTHVEGVRLLRFSVPMLTKDSVVMELSLEGFDADKLGANRS